MTRRRRRPLPPRRAMRPTVPPGPPPKHVRPALRAKKPMSAPLPPKPPRRQVARIIDRDETSLVDLIDNLLSNGVVLNADLVLALANVDLVYVRVSALLCAADRVLPLK